MSPPDLDALNQREFKKLVLSIEAQPQRLDLLLVVCDNRNLQARLISDYEAELAAAGITPLQTRLSHKRPSLRAALEELVAQTPALQAGEPAVVTVLNAGELLGVRLSDDKSEQERFFFSLQWTREALRQFHFPIVLWLPDALATRLAQQAPDFWSWRGGLFEFVAPPPIPTTAPQPREAFAQQRQETGDPDSQIPIADLQQQIADLAAASPDSPLLVTLHNTLGNAYQRQYDYQAALTHYEQALVLARTHQDLPAQARVLCNLGNALQNCGRPLQAVDYYQEALTLYRELKDRNGEAGTLNRLGIAHDDLSLYRQAIDFYTQYLAIVREIGDHFGESRALGDLGLAYYYLGEYQRAIKTLEKSLAIARETGNRQSESLALGNLGLAYDSLGQHQQAIDFHRQHIEIAHEIGDCRSESRALGNLGLAYYSSSQHQQAIDALKRSLTIAREIGDRFGESRALCNLGCSYRALGQYQQSTNALEKSLAIAREIGDRHGEAVSSYNKAVTLAMLDEKWESRALFESARTLHKDLGLHSKAEQCDEAIRILERQAVAIPKSAPTISPATDKPSSVINLWRRVPLGARISIGLGLVLLLGWWVL